MKSLLTIALLFVAVPVSAQTVAREFNLMDLGLGPVLHVAQVETDGDPFTEEALIQSDNPGAPEHGKLRVVAVRWFGLCLGEWFSLDADQGFFAGTEPHYSLITLGGRTHIRATFLRGTLLNAERVVRDIALDTPNCH